jgi:hypothetical protein
MRKATAGTERTEYETARNKALYKVRYIVEQHFGLSSLYNSACRARFPKLIKNALDAPFRQMACNLSKGFKDTQTCITQGGVCPMHEKTGNPERMRFYMEEK